MRIEIRPFQDTDTNGIRDLILPIQNDEFSLPITWEEQPDLHDIAGYYRKDAGDFWVAASGDQIVGSVSLVDLGQQNSALRKMFVAADFRGGEYSVAANLLATLITHAQEKNLARIYLGTTYAFRAAHRFYEKHGFDLVAHEDLPENFAFMKVDARFYRLDLG